MFCHLGLEIGRLKTWGMEKCGRPLRGSTSTPVKSVIGKLGITVRLGPHLYPPFWSTPKWLPLEIAHVSLSLGVLNSSPPQEYQRKPETGPNNPGTRARKRKSSLTGCLVTCHNHQKEKHLSRLYTGNCSDIQHSIFKHFPVLNQGTRPRGILRHPSIGLAESCTALWVHATARPARLGKSSEERYQEHWLVVPHSRKSKTQCLRSFFVTTSQTGLYKYIPFQD